MHTDYCLRLAIVLAYHQDGNCGLYNWECGPGHNTYVAVQADCTALTGSESTTQSCGIYQAASLI